MRRVPSGGTACLVNVVAFGAPQARTAKVSFYIHWKVFRGRGQDIGQGAGMQTELYPDLLKVPKVKESSESYDRYIVFRETRREDLTAAGCLLKFSKESQFSKAFFC